MNTVLLIHFALVIAADLTFATLNDGEAYQRMPWAPMYWYRGPHRPPEMIVMRPPATKIQLRHKKSPSISEQQQHQQQLNYEENRANSMGISRPHYLPRLPPPQNNNNNFTSVFYNYDSPLRLPYRQLTHHAYQAVTPNYDHNVYNQLKYRSTTSRPRQAPLTTTATPRRLRTKSKAKSKQANNKRHVTTQQQRNVNSRIYSRNYTQYSNNNNYYDKRQQRPNFDLMDDNYDRGFDRLDQQIPSPPPRSAEYYTNQPQLQPSYDFENYEIPVPTENYPKSSAPSNAQLYYQNQNNAQRQRTVNAQRQRTVNTQRQRTAANAPREAKRRDDYQWKESEGRRFDTPAPTRKSQDEDDYVYSVYDDVDEVFKGYESQRTNQRHQTTTQKQNRQRQ